jgi:hypothetical protein
MNWQSEKHGIMNRTGGMEVSSRYEEYIIVDLGKARGNVFGVARICPPHQFLARIIHEFVPIS